MPGPTPTSFWAFRSGGWALSAPMPLGLFEIQLNLDNRSICPFLRLIWLADPVTVFA